MMIWIVAAAGLFLAYSNGANDNFKGVASLFGSGAAKYRQALAWATVTTMAGALSALWLGQALVAKFSGRGIVSDQLTKSPEFAGAVAAGAGLTVILATLTGFPISTTHALTGAIVGVGLAALGTAIKLDALGKGFVLPLLLSPVLSILLVLVLNWITSRIGVGSGRITDGLHGLSAGAVSFARGLNDAPKIAAMVLAVQAMSPTPGFLVVAGAMAVGGLIHSRRIADTMSLRITKFDHREGLTANFATAILVLLASYAGLPVSTTHVSVGALLGIGIANRKADYTVIRGILLSWLLTLPCGALLGFVLYYVLKLLA